MAAHRKHPPTGFGRRHGVGTVPVQKRSAALLKDLLSPTERRLWGPFDFKECPRSVQATILYNLSLRRNPLCMNKLPRMDSNHDKVIHSRFIQLPELFFG